MIHVTPSVVSQFNRIGLWVSITAIFRWGKMQESTKKMVSFVKVFKLKRKVVTLDTFLNIEKYRFILHPSTKTDSFAHEQNFNGVFIRLPYFDGNARTTDAAFYTIPRNARGY